MSKVILLPHHDDEIFLFNLLMDPEFSPRNQLVIFIYLTFDNDNGEKFGLERMHASKKSIDLLNLQNFKIIDLGFELGIHSREIMSNRDKLTTRINEIFGEIDIAPIELYLPAPEFGHSDHLATSTLFSEIEKISSLYFFTTYSIGGCKKFKIQKQNPASKKIRSKILVCRLTIQAIMIYKHEWRTWLALGPIIIFQNLNLTSTHSIFTKNELDYLFTNIGKPLSFPFNNKKRKWGMQFQDYSNLVEEKFGRIVT